MPFKKLIFSILLVSGLAILWVSLLIYQYGNIRNEPISNAAIVLGAAVVDDQPSAVFKERINHAINLYNKGKVVSLIFTGGLGKGEQMTEAEVAKRYAIKQGVPEDRIYLEDKSQTTYENILFAKLIVNREQISSILLISDPLHMKRAMTIATDLGLSVNTAPTPTSRYKTWRTKTGFLAREVYFYISYLVWRLFN